MIIHDLIKDRMFVGGPTSLQMIVDNIQHNAKASLIKSLQCIQNSKTEQKIDLTDNWQWY